jgi:hypothetical protein
VLHLALLIEHERVVAVAILTDPEGPVLLDTEGAVGGALGVAIPTGPGERLLLTGVALGCGSARPGNSLCRCCDPHRTSKTGAGRRWWGA